MSTWGRDPFKKQRAKLHRDNMFPIKYISLHGLGSAQAPYKESCFPLSVFMHFYVQHGRQNMFRPDQQAGSSTLKPGTRALTSALAAALAATCGQDDTPASTSRSPAHRPSDSEATRCKRRRRRLPCHSARLRGCRPKVSAAWTSQPCPVKSPHLSLL